MAASMVTAPTDGTVFEAFFDGDWYEVYWSLKADDGSEYGTEGWAENESGYLIADLECWRPLNAVTYGEESELVGHRLRQPIFVIGMGFGDEAKGATVDYLSATIPDTVAVVRWSGGANAAHNVRHGHRHHTFRQFGSGSLLGVPTFLTERVVVNLQMLMAEAVQLEDLGVHNPLSLMAIHGDALVTTPIHMALNRAREILRGASRHGSCGVGIGETIVHGYADRQGLGITDLVGNFEISGETANGAGVLTVGKLLGADSEALEREVVAILKHQAHYAEPLIQEARTLMPELADELFYGSFSSIAQELVAVANSVDVLAAKDFDAELQSLMGIGTVIFEGSQGLLLDEAWGFHPHTTWARTEPSELVEWLRDLGHQPYILGLTRSFMTRHGAGPLPSARADDLSELTLPADDNSWGRWQGGFRTAALDLPLLHYSARILAEAGVEIDGISLSHLDAFGGSDVPVVVSYGDSLIPSYGWPFTSDRAEAFPRMNSDIFLEEAILNAEPILEHYSAEGLQGEIEISLGVPVVLLASGPSRRDRNLRRTAVLA